MLKSDQTTYSETLSTLSYTDVLSQCLYIFYSILFYQYIKLRGVQMEYRYQQPHIRCPSQLLYYQPALVDGLLTVGVVNDS